MAFEFIALNIKQEPPVDIVEADVLTEHSSFLHDANQMDCREESAPPAKTVNHRQSVAQTNTVPPPLYRIIPVNPSSTPSSSIPINNPAPPKHIPNDVSKTPTIEIDEKQQQLFDAQLKLLKAQTAKEHLEQELHRQSIKHDQELHELKMEILNAKLRSMEQDSPKYVYRDANGVSSDSDNSSQ